jgi:hypothetical protein
VLDQETAHPQLDPVALVGRDPAFPERLGYHAEHGTAIQLLAARLDRVYLKRADAA